MLYKLDDQIEDLKMRLSIALEGLRYISTRESRPNWLTEGSMAASDTLRVINNSDLLKHYFALL